MRITKKELLKDLRKIAKHYDITSVKFKKLSEEYGGVAHWDGSITVNKSLTKLKIVCAFFHEIAHQLNRRDGKFLIYHTASSWSDPSKFAHIRRTALRAERYTDKRGKKLMKEWMPNLTWDKNMGYTTKDASTFVRMHLDSRLEESEDD